MASLFYDHLIPWKTLEQSLQDMRLSKDEQLEVQEVIEEVLHTEILTVILTHLPTHKHDSFLERFHTAPYEKEHLLYLRRYTEVDIDEHIRIRSEEVFTRLLPKKKSSVLQKIKNLFSRLF